MAETPPWLDLDAAVRDVLGQARAMRRAGGEPCGVLMTDETRCWLYSQPDYRQMLNSRSVQEWAAPTLCGLPIAVDEAATTPRVMCARTGPTDANMPARTRANTQAPRGSLEHVKVINVAHPEVNTIMIGRRTDG